MQISNDNGLGFIEKTACTAAGTVGATMLRKKLLNSYTAPIIERIQAIPVPSAKDSLDIVTNMTQKPIIAKNNVKSFLIDEKNIKSVTKEINDIFSNKVTPLFKKQPDFLKGLKQGHEQAISAIINITQKGKGAFYHPLCNVAIAPKSNPLLLTHELGHAINANSFKGAKYICPALRAVPLVGAIAIPAIAMWQAFSNKENSFIKDNAGKITFLSFIPMIGEEALASIRAIKNSIVSKASKTIIQNQKKAFGLALSTYGAAAVLAGLTSAACVKLATIYKNCRKN